MILGYSNLWVALSMKVWKLLETTEPFGRADRIILVDEFRSMADDLENSGWPFEELLDHAQATPDWWAQLAPGKALQRLRWIQELSQAELAQRAGLGQSHVARIEAGNDCRVSTLWRLFAAMGYQPLIVARLDGKTPRVDPRKEPSPMLEYLKSGCLDDADDPK